MGCSSSKDDVVRPQVRSVESELWKQDNLFTKKPASETYKTEEHPTVAHADEPTERLPPRPGSPTKSKDVKRLGSPDAPVVVEEPNMVLPEEKPAMHVDEPAQDTPAGPGEKPESVVKEPKMTSVPDVMEKEPVVQEEKPQEKTAMSPAVPEEPVVEPEEKPVAEPVPEVPVEPKAEPEMMPMVVPVVMEKEPVIQEDKPKEETAMSPAAAPEEPAAEPEEKPATPVAAPMPEVPVEPEEKPEPKTMPMVVPAVMEKEQMIQEEKPEEKTAMSPTKEPVVEAEEKPATPVAEPMPEVPAEVEEKPEPEMMPMVVPAVMEMEPVIQKEPEAPKKDTAVSRNEPAMYPSVQDFVLCNVPEEKKVPALAVPKEAAPVVSISKEKAPALPVTNEQEPALYPSVQEFVLGGKTLSEEAQMPEPKPAPQDRMEPDAVAPDPRKVFGKKSKEERASLVQLRNRGDVTKNKKLFGTSEPFEKKTKKQLASNDGANVKSAIGKFDTRKPLTAVQRRKKELEEKAKEIKESADPKSQLKTSWGDVGRPGAYKKNVIHKKGPRSKKNLADLP